jgi:transposase InsO family protein
VDGETAVNGVTSNSRRVIGWAMSQLLDASLVVAALRMALSQRCLSSKLIVHSDRGRQFASAAYRQVLTQHRLTASMSRKGNCYDNAFIESFFSTLKYELVYHHRFAPSPRLALLSSITLKPSTIGSDFIPVLPIKAQSLLNPN